MMADKLIVGSPELQKKIDRAGTECSAEGGRLAVTNWPHDYSRAKKNGGKF